MTALLVIADAVIACLVVQKVTDHVLLVIRDAILPTGAYRLCLQLLAGRSTLLRIGVQMHLILSQSLLVVEKTVLLDHVLCSAGLSMIGNNLMLHRVLHVWWSGT